MMVTRKIIITAEKISHTITTAKYIDVRKIVQENGVHTHENYVREINIYFRSFFLSSLSSTNTCDRDWWTLSERKRLWEPCTYFAFVFLFVYARVCVCLCERPCTCASVLHACCSVNFDFCVYFS